MCSLSLYTGYGKNTDASPGFHVNCLQIYTPYTGMTTHAPFALITSLKAILITSSFTVSLRGKQTNFSSITPLLLRLRQKLISPCILPGNTVMEWTSVTTPLWKSQRESSRCRVWQRVSKGGSRVPHCELSEICHINGYGLWANCSLMIGSGTDQLKTRRSKRGVLNASDLWVTWCWAPRQLSWAPLAPRNQALSCIIWRVALATSYCPNVHVCLWL